MATKCTWTWTAGKRSCPRDGWDGTALCYLHDNRPDKASNSVMPHNAPRSLTTFVAILMSVGLLPTAAKSQANDFAEAIQTLAPNSTLPDDFITTYIDIPDVSLIAEFSETTLREFWTENTIHHLAISYTAGPCSDVLFVTLDDHGDVIDYQQILRGCDMDGGGGQT